MVSIPSCDISIVVSLKVLGPLLFLFYNNDLNCAFKYYSVHHFVDDTNLLNYNNSVKRMNKQVNQDLKNLTNWLNANKICLNVSKTEVALFKLSRKLTDVPLILKLNGKKTLPHKLSEISWYKY